jgi:shikimate dehydrogenase
MSEVLELGAGGWLLEGQSWTPAGPFFGVLGDPIDHSLSPMMQQAALAEREIDLEYLPIRVQTGQLKSIKKGEPGTLLAGFNATAPLKEAVAALCDGRTDQARTLGAVNTVKVEEGKWLGHNTDSGGILSVLTEGWRHQDHPTRGVVLGAGGSARAAVDALARWNVPSIEVWNRSAAGQERFRTWVSGQEYSERVLVKGLPSEGTPTQEPPVVFVCCLAGGVSAQPFLPDAAGGGGALLLDLRYGPQLPAGQVPLGFDFSDGKPVLLMQGGLSFTWWFGPPVPWDAMRDAIT